MWNIELPSGKIVSEQEMNSIQDEIISIFARRNLSICNSKAILKDTERRIEEVTLLQVPAQ